MSRETEPAGVVREAPAPRLPSPAAAAPRRARGSATLSAPAPLAAAAPSRRPYLTVAMPVYNEEAILARNAVALAAALEGHGLDWELVIVDDGSRDRTAAIGAALARAYPRVRLYRHRRNRGVCAAIRSAIRVARGEWLMMVPADLAMRLEQIPRYLAASAGADVVLGVCPVRSDYSRYRYFLSHLNVWLLRTLFRLPYHQFNYVNLYRTEVLQALPLERTGSAFLYAEIVVHTRDRGGRIAEVPVDYVPRAGGAATGASSRLVLRTGRDMLGFWLRHAVLRRPRRIGRSR
jgi:glycosyltransferase involved in cell wall biosynthesis